LAAGIRGSSKIGVGTMTMRVYILSERLSDGSIGYAVRIPYLTIDAISHQDAEAMAEKITAAIRDHSNEDSDYVELM
jgi:hypothetical protein